MNRKISGNELRDRLLSRLKSAGDSQPNEETRIQALSSSGNRDLLEVIATKRPRSISELAELAGRLQPNVSRSLAALARAGLVRVTADGRASVPGLTPDGERKARDLGFFVPRSTGTATPAAIAIKDERVVSVIVAGSSSDDPATDATQADITVRFPATEAQQAAIVHAELDLNDFCKNLLANWWRVVSRRDDPFKMFPVAKEVATAHPQAILLAESTGQMALFVRSTADDGDGLSFPRIALAEKAFTTIMLDELVRPLISHLRAGSRFDRPVESLLRRTEEILGNPPDLKFWRTAGGLGLSYENMSETVAANVTKLVDAVSNEDARLDLASANTPDKIVQSLGWVEREVACKAKTNVLPQLVELRMSEKPAVAGIRPWQFGKQRALDARRQIGLAQDRSVGGISGLAKMFGGKTEFMASSASEELLRGFQGLRDDVPVVVVKEEGPRSTAFLLSRAIGDYLAFGSREAPIVNIYSDRQAVGRAFAAEFMAPAEGVVRMMEEDGASLDTVAEHYGVGHGVVRHQYENNLARYANAAA